MIALPQTRKLTRETASVSPETGALRFDCEWVHDKAAVDALIDRAFGPGRFAKTAERLREGAGAPSPMSVCAWAGDGLAGAVRLWPATLGCDGAAFLGPIAVETAFRRHGLGAQLVEQACIRAHAAGERAVILIGDPSFFEPLGFERVASGRVSLPGPVDPGRLLWTALCPDALQSLGGLLRVIPAA